jgi:branched-subunit amino acid transport protein
MNHWQMLLTIFGMAFITLLTRAAFSLPERELPLPGWLREALRHAPLAALVAVVFPEIVLADGHGLTTWREPRLFAAAAGAAWYFWQRSLLGTIVVGSAVMLALKLGLHW